jgi:hypothetical protein
MQYRSQGAAAPALPPTHADMTIGALRIPDCGNEAGDGDFADRGLDAINQYRVVVRQSTLERPCGDWDEAARETAVEPERQEPFRHMRHTARPHVRKACDPNRSHGVEVAYDQIDTVMGGDNVAQLPSIASLPVIEMNIRNLDAREFKDERDPLTSRFGLWWAQIPPQARREVRCIEVPESLGAPCGQSI